MTGNRCTLMGLLALACILSTGGVSAAQSDTYAVTASVVFCDVDPDTVPRQDFTDVCGDAIAGTSVSVADTSDTIGSCTTETTESPNGGVINSCGIDGAGYNTTLTFTLDEATLPDGYILQENDLTVEVDNLIPGGGDQTTVTFTAFADDATAATEPSPSALPPLGANPAIQTGSCDAPGDVAAELGALAAEDGTPVGAPTGIGPNVSATTIDIPLDTLIDEPHHISITGINQLEDNRILCGDIGGVDNDDGTLYIVLKPADPTAGPAGMAVLSYGDDPAIETDVRLYVLTTQ